MSPQSSPLLDAIEDFVATRKFLFRAALIGFCIAFVAMEFGFPLTSDTLFTNDMCVLAWAHRLSQPDAFPADISVDYYQAVGGAIGYRALFWLGTRLFEVQTFAELLPIPLGLFMLWMAYRTGKEIGGGRRSAGAIATLALASLCTGKFLGLWAELQGGLNRCFYFPAMISLAYALCSKRYAWAAVALVTGWVFYQPAFVMIAVILPVHVVTTSVWSERPGTHTIFSLAAITLFLGALSYLMLVRRPPPFMGEMISWEEATKLPIFSGHITALVLAPTRLGSLVASRWWITSDIAITIALFALILVWTRPRFGRRFLVTLASLFLGSAATVTVAYLVALRLYYPNRYAGGYFIGAWLLVAGAGIALIEHFAARWKPGRWRLSGSRAAAIFWIALAVLPTGAVSFEAWRRTPGPNDAGHLGIYRTPLGPTILEAVRKLPPNALVAAEASVGPDIPLLTTRSVFWGVHDMHPHHRSYFANARERLRRHMNGLCGRTWEDAVAFAKQDHVTHALVSLDACQHPPEGWRRSYDELTPPLWKAGVLLGPRGSVVAADDGFLLIEFP